MAEIEGYVTVYESSDGATGDPDQTIWQFFVYDGIKNTPVRTKNVRLARTMRLAIETNREVKVIYDEMESTMSQARIEYEYICESQKVYLCDSNGTEKEICQTRRLSRCKPDIPPGS
ncbi:MAG: hypothetical protein KJO31_11440 [Gammaproteobacteria bacterium]|nr:hypothetical protein [Gammaproteobacteria bacterium]